MFLKIVKDYSMSAIGGVIMGGIIGGTIAYIDQYYINKRRDKSETSFPLDKIKMEKLNKMKESGKNLIIINELITAHTAEFVKKELDAIKNDFPIDFVLNTFGGCGEACMQICALIRNKPNQTRAIVPSHTLSSGVYIMFQCNEIHMAPTAVVSPIDLQNVTYGLFGIYKQTVSIDTYIRALDKIGWNVSREEAMYAINLQKIENIYKYSIKLAISENQHCPEDRIDALYDFLHDIYPHNTKIAYKSLVRRGLVIKDIPEEYEDVFDIKIPNKI